MVLLLFSKRRMQQDCKVSSCVVGFLGSREKKVYNGFMGVFESECRRLDSARFFVGYRYLSEVVLTMSIVTYVVDALC